MPNILDDIVAAKRREVAAAKLDRPAAELEARLAAAPPPARGFEAALRRRSGGGEVAVIAEVKKASPSAGVLRADFDPAAVARAYEAGGAAALSVLTDGPFFQGTLADLVAARAAVALPVLRKDFVVDHYQLVEARAAGADAVLLIAEVLPGAELGELLAQARELGLDALVELHDAPELERVLAAGATLVGINNRDLRTFETRLAQTLEIAPRVPPAVLLVSESGIRTAADLALLAAAGVRAALVGESLMRSADIAGALRRLRGVGGDAGVALDE